MYGGFTSNVDMKSARRPPARPNMRAPMAGGQLARRYRIPYRSSNACAANAVDAQAAYESEMSIWGAVMGHCNWMLHGAGWMEGGLVASFEKLILDAELLQMMGEFLQPLVVDEDSLALDAIREVGPAATSGAAHTLARYEHAFYAPMLSDWRNFETWREAGALTADQARERAVEAALGGVRAAGAGPRDRRGAQGVRRAPQARGRRARGLTPPSPERGGLGRG